MYQELWLTKWATAAAAAVRPPGSSAASGAGVLVLAKRRAGAAFNFLPQGFKLFFYNCLLLLEPVIFVNAQRTLCGSDIELGRIAHALLGFLSNFSYEGWGIQQ